MAAFCWAFRFIVFMTYMAAGLCDSRFVFGRYQGSLGGAPGTESASKSKGVSFRQSTTTGKEQYFPQKLDHFDAAEKRTWQQRYWTTDQYYKTGGPVFVMIGPEGPVSAAWLTRGQWVELAKKFGAYCFILEHRYYGKSRPTTDLSTKNLRYLTTRQALADLANFLTDQMKTLKLQNSKVVTFGSSYAGSLSAWFRSKYPSISFAAVASSAPIIALENLQEFMPHVETSLARTSPVCVQNFATANKQLEDALNGNAASLSDLKTKLRLCESLSDSKDKRDPQNLVQLLAANVANIVQYNRANRGSPLAAISIDQICQIMNDTTVGTPLNRYAKLNGVLLDASGYGCLAFTYSAFLASMQELPWTDSSSLGGRQWMYQSCTELGYFVTSDGIHHPFAKMFPVSLFRSVCKDLFGIDVPAISKGVDATNAFYGGRALKVDRVLFVHGDIDPWMVVGMTKDVGPLAPTVVIKVPMSFNSVCGGSGSLYRLLKSHPPNPLEFILAGEDPMYNLFHPDSDDRVTEDKNAAEEPETVVGRNRKAKPAGTKRSNEKPGGATEKNKTPRKKLTLMKKRKEDDHDYDDDDVTIKGAVYVKIKNDKKQLDDEVKKLKEQQREKNAEAGNLKRKVNVLERKISEFEPFKKRYQDTSKEYTDERGKWEEAEKKLRCDLDMAHWKAADLRNQLIIAKKVEEELKERLSSQEKTEIELLEHLASTVKAKLELENELGVARAELGERRDSHATLEKQSEHFKQTIKARERTILDLQSSLAELKEHNRELLSAKEDIDKASKKMAEVGKKLTSQ